MRTAQANLGRNFTTFMLNYIGKIIAPRSGKTGSNACALTVVPFNEASNQGRRLSPTFDRRLQRPTFNKLLHKSKMFRA